MRGLTESERNLENIIDVREDNKRQIVQYDRKLRVMFKLNF